MAPDADAVASEPKKPIEMVDGLARDLLELEIQRSNGCSSEEVIADLKARCEDAYVRLQETLGDERIIQLLKERIPLVRQRYVEEVLVPLCYEGRVADRSRRLELFAELTAKTGGTIYGGPSFFRRPPKDWTSCLLLEVPQPSPDLLR